MRCIHLRHPPDEPERWKKCLVKHCFEEKPETMYWHPHKELFYKNHPTDRPTEIDTEDVEWWADLEDLEEE